jgi:hypothetical protein
MVLGGEGSGMVMKPHEPQSSSRDSSQERGGRARVMAARAVGSAAITM